MEHLAFYQAGCESKGLKSRVRRLFRRVFLPAFRRLVEILASLCRRLDIAEHEVADLKRQVDDLRRRNEDLSAKLPAMMAFGWDYVAMVRRLAVLEEHVDALLAARDGAGEPELAANSAHADQPARSRVG